MAAIVNAVTVTVQEVWDSLGIPADGLDASRPLDNVLITLVEDYAQMNSRVRWNLERSIHAAVAAWNLVHAG
jgi:hypothetical protein